ALVALFFGSLTVLMVAFTVIIIFWDTYRILAAVLVTSSFLLATVGFGLLARSRLKMKSRFMAARIAEVKRDREALDRMTQRDELCASLSAARRLGASCERPTRRTRDAPAPAVAPERAAAC